MSEVLEGKPIDWGESVPLKGTEQGYVVAVLAPEEFERLVEAISDSVIRKLSKSKTDRQV